MLEDCEASGGLEESPRSQLRHWEHSWTQGMPEGSLQTAAACFLGPASFQKLRR